MKRIQVIIIFLLFQMSAIACDVCNMQQPEILRGITHGSGPEDNWDYVIVWATVAIVLFTLYFSVKWLIRPGERSKDHIKRLILNIE